MRNGALLTIPAYKEALRIKEQNRRRVRVEGVNYWNRKEIIEKIKREYAEKELDK